MPWVDSNGANIWYKVKGKGTPLLLCNGWGGSSDSWSSDMVSLLAEKHMVVLLDNRGTGRSDKPNNPYTMEIMVEDSNQVLTKLNLGLAHVLGFSMGGMIAQALAIYHPESVRSLILCATSPGAANSIPITREASHELARVSDERIPKHDQVKALIYLLYPREYIEPRLEELINEESYDTNPTPVYALKSQSAATATFDSYDRLQELKIPALILTGGNDRLIPPDNSRLLAERIPGGELHILPGLGHGFLKQATAQVVDLILEFTSRVDKQQ
ncbi:MAG: alpha/beta hydrolase [Candidatus Bathyarchaeia archaeon]|jgi:pimeloyl-ACP methyl ester carboxylesterase